MTSQPSKVEIAPLTADQDINARRENILRATRWFSEARVEVDEGIVFLSGIAQRAEHKQWAGELRLELEMGQSWFPAAIWQ